MKVSEAMVSNRRNKPFVINTLLLWGRDQSLTDRLRAIYNLAGLGSDAAEAIPALISMLDEDHQAARVAAIYTLGMIGEPAVAPLMERLKTAGRREDARIQFPNLGTRVLSQWRTQRTL